MKTVIYSGVFCQDEENREIVRLWGRLTRHLNPDVDIVAFDSCSPFDPAYFLPSIPIVRFRDNPGHLSRGGGDGAGRTFCQGMKYAAEMGYDFCVHLESDMLLARPVTPIISAMAKAGVKAACCYLPQYQFFEWGVAAFNVQHLADTDFCGRYDWANAPMQPIPEVRIEQLIGDDLFVLPLRGHRNDQNQLNPYNLANVSPYFSPDFLTRANMDLAMRFLELNNIVLPEES